MGQLIPGNESNMVPLSESKNDFNYIEYSQKSNRSREKNTRSQQYSADNSAILDVLESEKL